MISLEIMRETMKFIISILEKNLENDSFNERVFVEVNLKMI